MKILSLICHGWTIAVCLAPKVANIAGNIAKVASMIVAISSATAAVIPRTDPNGVPSEVHAVLDVLALNVLNSAHDMGLATEIEEKDSASIMEKAGTGN